MLGMTKEVKYQGTRDMKEDVKFWEKKEKKTKCRCNQEMCTADGLAII